MDNYTKIMQMSRDELTKFIFDIAKPFLSEWDMGARKDLYMMYRNYLDMEAQQ